MGSVGDGGGGGPVPDKAPFPGLGDKEQDPRGGGEAKKEEKEPRGDEEEKELGEEEVDWEEGTSGDEEQKELGDEEKEPRGDEEKSPSGGDEEQKELGGGAGEDAPAPLPPPLPYQTAAEFSFTTDQIAQFIGLRCLADAELFVPVLRLNLEKTSQEMYAIVFCRCILAYEKG